MVFRLERATPRLKALAVGPWKRGSLLKDLVRELLGGGSMGVYSCWVYGVPMEPLLLWLWVAST